MHKPTHTRKFLKRFKVKIRKLDKIKRYIERYFKNYN